MIDCNRLILIELLVCTFYAEKTFVHLYPILYFFFFLLYNFVLRTIYAVFIHFIRVQNVFIRKELLEIWETFDLFSNPKSVKFMNSKSCIYLYFTCGGFSFNNRSVFISRFIVPLGNIRKFRNDKKVWKRPLRNAFNAQSSHPFFLNRLKRFWEMCIILCNFIEVSPMA